MKLLNSIFLLLIFGLSFSCQKHPVAKIVAGGDPRTIEKNPTNTQDRVESLDLIKKLRLSNATLFLWKQDSSDLQLADVLRGLRKYDEVEDDAYDFGMIIAKVEDLSERKSELEFQAKKQDPKPTAEELLAIEEQLKTVERDLKDADSAKDRLYLKYGSEEKLMADMSENGDRLEKLFKVVDTLDTLNPTFLFDVKEEGLSLEIEGVKFTTAQTLIKYSTSLGNIKNLEFKSQGAVLNFEVLTEPNVVFEFRLRRVSYEDKGGRIIFKGDMNKIVYGSNSQVVEKRVGQAKINTNYKN